jgi:hypothetical protein
LNRRISASARILVCFEHNLVPADVVRNSELDVLFDGHSSGYLADAKRSPGGSLGFRAPGQQSLRWIPMTHKGIASEIRKVSDLPVFHIPREGPAPLYVEYESRNDGTTDRLTATVINTSETTFPKGRLRFVMRHGRYRLTGGEIVQYFDSDDNRFTILDVCSVFVAKGRSKLSVELVSKGGDSVD